MAAAARGGRSLLLIADDEAAAATERGTFHGRLVSIEERACGSTHAVGTGGGGGGEGEGGEYGAYGGGAYGMRHALVEMAGALKTIARVEEGRRVCGGGGGNSGRKQRRSTFVHALALKAQLEDDEIGWLSPLAAASESLLGDARNELFEKD